MTDSKRERQHRLEQQSVTEGVVRYRRGMSTKDESDLKPGKALLTRTMSILVDAIQQEKDAGDMARRGRPSVYGKYMAAFDADVLAYTTSRLIINNISHPTPCPATGLFIRIGTALEEALLYSELRPLEPNLFNAMERKAKKATTSHHSRAVMNKAAAVAKEKHPSSVTGLEWTPRDKVILGAKLAEIFIETTGLAELRNITRNRKSRQIIRGTAATLEWLKNQHGQCELMEPVYLPMVVPPRDWLQPIGGGYLGESDMPSIPLIKTRDRDTIDEYFSTDMPEVYKAVNIIQQTAWRINKPVLQVMRTLADTERDVAGLPGRDAEPIPAKPHDIDTNEPARREWRASAAKAYDVNARSTSKRLALFRVLYIAELMEDEDEIFFPHQLDFRGRIYPIPTGLNPQANDAGKGILQFAHGKPLGPTGAFWLAVHIANCYGYDKASLEERVAWVEEHQDLIFESATNPLDTDWWMEGDKPFCLLAACYEWLGYQLEGEDYVSHLPIAMDGSCSGLQHYSALLRDSIGGAAVNLTPAEKPADIYTTVKDKVEAIIAADVDNPLARAWMGKVTRKIVKQPCMTYAYSATARGMRDQIVYWMRRADSTGNYIPGWAEWEAANYLAPLVREAIRSTVVAASTAMDWLQDAIRKLNKAKLPCIWTTPVGLPVIQREMQYKAQKVQIMFEGKRLSLNYAITTKVINSRKQLSGIAPNYIHSMDSAHLMKTVNACNEQGIIDFAMVHDSFGCHACHVDELNAVLREEFIGMYSVSRLQEFKEQSEALLGEELPTIPSMGDLELDLVEESDFFFS